MLGHLIGLGKNSLKKVLDVSKNPCYADFSGVRKHPLRGKKEPKMPEKLPEAAPSREPTERKADLVCHLCKRELNCNVICKDTKEKILALGMLMIQHTGSCHQDTMMVVQFRAAVMNAVMLSNLFDVNVPEVIEQFKENRAEAHEWLDKEPEAQEVLVQGVRGLRTKLGRG